MRKHQPVGLDDYAKHQAAKMIIVGLIAIAVITGCCLAYLYWK